ncbi:MAG TPA: condensation domain-containing protein, partial [Candidatus Deferrimicrobium sp.]|nr:condensation domain-containing protein [Candidatus Deferrimicrobium sp.]
MPLTRNGKIDRDALPEPGIDPGEGKYAAPRDRIEEQLVEIWADVLKIGKEELGIDSNFFELGGHSLKAAILVSRIHKLFAVRIPLDKLFQAPYIREFAAYIKESGIKHFNAIPAQEKKEYYPLTSQMRRLYFELQIDPESVIYNMIMTAVLEGNLQRQKLDETFRKLIRRHEALRTSFATAHGELVMKVHDEVDFEIEDMELGKQPETVLHIFNRRFDLFKAPLFRVGLAKKGEQEHVLAICISHTIADGTSQGLMLKDLMMLYEGKDPAPLRIQYKDFSQWQKTGEIAESIKKQETYWLNRFSGEIPLLDLPLDFPRPPVKSFKGAVIHDSIGPGETKQLNEFVKSEKDATLYMALLTVYNLVLFKLSGQEDIVVGTPMAGRKNADLEFVVGMFVNTVALRNYPAGDKTAREFFNEVKTSTFEALENQDSRFENLVEQVNITRRLDRTPLFDVFLALQNWYMPTVEIPGLRLRPLDVKSNISRFDMGFHIFHDESQLNILVEYSTQLFKESTIKRFIDYFKRALLEAIQNPGKRISEINIISEAEMRKILYEFNETETKFPGGKTIHGLFVEQVEETPDHIALIDSCIRITYRELNAKSDISAFSMQAKGVQPDTIVGIMAERSPEMVIGILGILKAGGAYLPIDFEYPEDRINYMLKDSGAKLLVTTNDKEGEKVRRWEGEKVLLESMVYDSNHLKGRPRRGLHHSNQLAYVI